MYRLCWVPETKTAFISEFQENFRCCWLTGSIGNAFWQLLSIHFLFSSWFSQLKKSAQIAFFQAGSCSLVELEQLKISPAASTFVESNQPTLHLVFVSSFESHFGGFGHNLTLFSACRLLLRLLAVVGQEVDLLVDAHSVCTAHLHTHTDNQSITSDSQFASTISWPTACVLCWLNFWLLRSLLRLSFFLQALTLVTALSSLVLLTDCPWSLTFGFFLNFCFFFVPFACKFPFLRFFAFCSPNSGQNGKQNESPIDFKFSSSD